MSPISTAARSRRFDSSRLVAAVVATTLATGGALAAAAPASAAEPGGQTTGDSLFPNVGNTGYDVSHYDIELAYDHADGSIEATTTIDAIATVELSSFSLDFEGLTVDAVTVNGASATFERVIDEDATKFKLVVTPATPISGTFTTVVEYSGVPTTHEDPDGSEEGWVPTPDGASAVSEPVGAMTWFPNNNTPLDKATFDFAFTIPTEIDGGPAAAASNGELISQTADPVTETTTWVWEQTEQMATYLSLASIGRFDVYVSQIALETSGRTIPEWSFIDPSIPADDLDDSLSSRDQLGTILNALESKFGTYPGNSTGMVVDGAGVGYALETQDRPFYDTSADLATTIHETVHQWFGDAVSAQDWSDIWLNEGPAELFTYDVLNEEYEEPAAESELFDLWSQIPETSTFWTVPVAGFDDPADLFGAPVYYRASMALEALRLSVGDDDIDALFRQWYSRYNDGDGSTVDFMALAEEISGEDLDAFFQEWLFDADKPAWPNVWTLDLASDPAAGTELARGDEITYTLEAANTGLGALTGATAIVDLSAVLPSAEIDESTLPDELALAGETLTWSVPDVPAGASPASVSFTATVGESASTGPLSLNVTPVGLGVTCLVCEASNPVAVYPIAPVGQPTISGTAVVGETLTIDPGEWAEGTTFEYQWFRYTAEDEAALDEALADPDAVDPVLIADLLEPVNGATTGTYTLQQGDVGYAFFAVVLGSLPGFEPVVAITDATAFVAAAPVPTASATPTATPTPAAFPTGLASTGTDGAPLWTAAWAAASLIAIGAAAAAVAVKRRRTERV
jgi:hypothetical protein